jgi:hypothetical protein
LDASLEYARALAQAEEDAAAARNAKSAADLQDLTEEQLWSAMCREPYELATHHASVLRQKTPPSRTKRNNAYERIRARLRSMTNGKDDRGDEEAVLCSFFNNLLDVMDQTCTRVARNASFQKRRRRPRQEPVSSNVVVHVGAKKKRTVRITPFKSQARPTFKRHKRR